MNQHAILSAIGLDRPGLVDEVSKFIFERGGNIEDSRMANLRGQFAMMVLVTAPQSAMARIAGELGELAQQSRLHAELCPVQGNSAAAEPAMPYRLKATAMDQAGLVHRVANLLRKLNVNIESLETQLAAAPYTGAPMFEMELILSVPPSVHLNALRAELGQLCDELNIDWLLNGPGEV